MFEADLRNILAAIVPRVYPDVAPQPLPAGPYVVYQQAGGRAINPLSVTHAADLPDLRHARMQITVWATTRAAANTASRQIEDALRLATAFTAQPLGAMTADHDPDTGLYGARQDFSIWYR